jgi:hypothetical protein
MSVSNASLTTISMLCFVPFVKPKSESVVYVPLYGCGLYYSYRLTFDSNIMKFLP